MKDSSGITNKSSQKRERFASGNQLQRIVQATTNISFSLGTSRFRNMNNALLIRNGRLKNPFGAKCTPCLQRPLIVKSMHQPAFCWSDRPGSGHSVLMRCPHNGIHQGPNLTQMDKEGTESHAVLLLLR